ncbi:MAG: Maf-like protein YhdE [Proteobacteria bacterium]|nr:MAG: Maf-like protein YhdE [Pseudomonadota bacterium]
MTKFILASQSQRRIDFLTELGYQFDIMAADIDESAKKAERPRDYVRRVALEKAQKIASENPNRDILAADTVCAVGRRLLGKPTDKNQAFEYIKMMSGTSHRVYSSVCLIKANGEVKNKVIETRVKFRPMSNQDINHYLENEANWKGFAGGYAIQSTVGSSLVKSIVGSPSSVIGLPLYETQCLLKQI